MKKSATKKRSSTGVQTKNDDARGIDYGDIPDMGGNATFWANAVPFVPSPPKQQLTMRLDQDIIDWFRQQGRGYQTHINAALRVYMEHTQPRARLPKRRK